MKLIHNIRRILAACVLVLGTIGLALGTGCASAPRIPTHIPGALPGTTEGIAAAHGALWPLYLASFICILGGAAYFVFMKNAKLLAVGVGLALIPPIFLMFLQPIAPYVAWVLLVAAATFAGLFVYHYYRKWVLGKKNGDAE